MGIDFAAIVNRSADYFSAVADFAGRWEESKHPRNHGKFAKKGQGSSGSSGKKPHPLDAAKPVKGKSGFRHQDAAMNKVNKAWENTQYRMQKNEDVLFDRSKPKSARIAVAKQMLSTIQPFVDFVNKHPDRVEGVTGSEIHRFHRDIHQVIKRIKNSTL